MALVTTLRVGCLRKCKDPVLLGRNCELWITPIATIAGKANRINFAPKPSPWPYKKFGYRNPILWIDRTTKRFDENTRIVTVEGPPAIGKSKVAYKLAEEFGMKYFPMVTMDYLFIDHYGYDSRSLNHKLPPRLQNFDEAAFLKEPHSWNSAKLCFELYALKYSQYIDALMHLFNTGQGVVLERSMWTDEAFAQAMYDCSFIYKSEMDGYKVYQERSREDMLKPHLMVYLDASVDTVLENLKKRGKGEEKVYNREFLTVLEETHKRRCLTEMEKHSELLMYDWNEPGDAEGIIEDIENTDLNRYDHHDTRLADWLLQDEEEYCYRRWLFTQRKPQLMTAVMKPLVNCPRLYYYTQDNQEREAVFKELPTYDYVVGFNPAAGDKVTFKMKFPSDPECECLPDNVTEMKIKELEAEIAADEAKEGKSAKESRS